MHVLVTGATGFIGRALVTHLLASGRRVTAVVRNEKTAALPNSKNLTIIDAGDMAMWAEFAPRIVNEDVDTVVHLAGLAHVPRIHKPSDAKQLSLINSINVEATHYLCQQALSAGVKQFIYISSVKVHGGKSGIAKITEEAPLMPDDEYASSKIHAEEAVASICGSSPMAFTIMRPALVYGSEAKGNFSRLIKWIQSGYPIPLDSIKNQRSFLARTNFIGAIDAVLMNAAAYNETFLVADSTSISTPDLIRALSRIIGVRPRLVSLPIGLAQMIFWLIGRGDDWKKLSESYVIDASKLTRFTGWCPRVTLDEELRDYRQREA